MPEITEYAPGTPSWVDLGSPDLGATKAFYGALFGWVAEDAGPPEQTGGYGFFTKDGKQVAGFGPQQQPGPPYWTSYVTVTDADDTAAKVKDAGGAVFVEPMDVMDAGRMAVFADVTGAPFSVWQPGAHRGAELANEPGAFCWNELNTRDPDAAKAFYGAVFGWGARTSEGPMSYTEFLLGDRSIAGMLDMRGRVPDEVPAHWMVYFAVDDIDAAVARAQELGAALTVPVMDSPAGRFAVVTDPTGAHFAMIALQAM